MKTKIFLLVIIMVLFTHCLPASAEGLSVKNENKKETWESAKNDALSEWNAIEKGEKKDWQNVIDKEITGWKRYKHRILLKWNKFMDSTSKIWVDYSDNLGTRSIVDFSKGKIRIETSISENNSSPGKEAEINISRQFEKILEEKDFAQMKILDRLIINSRGEVVGDKNVEDFLTNEILPTMRLNNAGSNKGQGNSRRSYGVTINMVPDHIRVRAERYVSIVKHYARRFNLSPQLIMAIIHTESCFNPMAVSSSGACGLMQIIPDQAGAEAFTYLYGDGRKISREYLFNPVKNIELGCAYFFLLENKYFNDVKGRVKQGYLSICGYNWGPSAVRKNILNRFYIGNSSGTEVFNLLRRVTPRKIGKYLDLVTRRIAIYNSFFENSEV